MFTGILNSISNCCGSYCHFENNIFDIILLTIQMVKAHCNEVVTNSKWIWKYDWWIRQPKKGVAIVTRWRHQEGDSRCKFRSKRMSFEKRDNSTTIWLQRVLLLKKKKKIYAPLFGTPKHTPPQVCVACVCDTWRAAETFPGISRPEDFASVIS